MPDCPQAFLAAGEYQGRCEDPRAVRLKITAREQQHGAGLSPR